MNESQNPFDVNGNGSGGPSTNAAPSGGQVPQRSAEESNAPQGADVSSEGSATNGASASQRPYGQTKVPEYGAMASQFPAQYNPYVYGRPDEKPKPQNGQTNSRDGQFNRQPEGGYGNGMGPYQGNQGNAPYGGPYQMPGGYLNNPNNSYGQPYNNAPMQAGGPGTPGYRPDMHNGVDMNDPVQNPYLGHWDPMAIASVILLFLPITFLPAITGALSMWRTRKYHMKGFWVATVCMVLGVIATIFSLWLFSKGITLNDLSQQLLNQSGSGPAPGGSGGGSVSA